MTKCPTCGQELRHPLEEAVEKQREAAPEVDHDPQDGCENLVAKPWKKQDFSKNLGNEEVE